MAHGDMGVALRMDALAAALQIGGLAILAASGRLSAATAFVCAAVGAGTAAALWHLRTARHLRPARGPLLRDWGTAAAFGRWLGAARLASVGHGYVVPWVLAWFVTLDDVGGYAAAFSLIAATNPLLTGLTNVLAPRAARAWDEGGTAAVRAVVHRATVGFTAATAAFAGGVVLLARELLVLLYGASYAPYAPVAAVLTVSLVASALGTPADHGLRTLGRPQDTFVASLCGVLATLVSALALVPLAGAVGGAYGLAAGSVVAAAVRLAAFHQAAGRATVRTPVAALERI
jgi:O-antigen/teichoic acid export membrane protein